MKKLIVKRQSSKLGWLVLFAVIILFASVFAYKALVRPADIALVAEPTPTCTSGISSFSTTGSCGAKGLFVERVDYTCQEPGRVGYEGGSGSCIDPLVAFEHARAFCGESCVAPTESVSPRPSCVPLPIPCPTGAQCKPSVPLASGRVYCPQTTTGPRPSTTPMPSTPPTPTPPSTPPPTSDPSPLVSCETEVYRLPAKLDLSQINSDTLAKYKINTRNIQAKVGERYAFNTRLTNIKKYPLESGNLSLSVWSSNALGSMEPYNILRTGSSCITSDSKTISCLEPSLNLNKRQSVRPNTFAIVDIARVKKTTKSEFKYAGIYSASTFDCPTVKFQVLPDPIKKCYGSGRLRWCRYIQPR